LPAEADAYHGVESVPTISEATQARYYASLVRIAACDPNIARLNIYHLIDETDLDRFQSGLLRADGSKRPSFDAVQQAVATAACSPPRVWRHTSSVAGARAVFDDLGPKRATQDVFGFSAYAQEDAYGSGSIV